MALYALTVFVSAFLLFQVQPIIAKMILPWFGGSAMVWTCCMLFFQTMLLIGYGYSHHLVRLAPKQQRNLHLGMLGLSLISLPLIPRASLKPEGGDNPLFGILAVLFLTVGIPYLMLATTGPLMQAWYAATHPGRLPYRLFALSNFGSLLALVGYPFLLEPSVPLRMQGIAWSGLYALFVTLCAWMAFRFGSTHAAAPGDETAQQEVAPPSQKDRWIWIALPACASALLLAVTNHLSQNVAAIPFLWVVPLALYLLSFMLTFDSDFWYKRWFYCVLAAATLCAMAYPIWKNFTEVNMRAYILAYCAGLLIVCMFCHGEVARRKPHPRYLTGFYLSISVGGALGGLLVSVASPVLFDHNYELSVAMALTGLVGLMVFYRENWLADILWAGISIFLVATVYQDIREGRADNIFMARNFYGSLRVRESGNEVDGSKMRTLVHGTINHGSQFIAQDRQMLPTTYYGTKSGVGLAISETRHPNMKLGVIGLGTGTTTTYGRSGDTIKIYEINPLVVDIARSWFTYLKNCPATVNIVMGDARLSLEREQPNQFDVLAVDAFSSDAIPVHLLTREAVELFFRHVRPGGIVALHISNKYLNLYPVAERIGKELGKQFIYVESRENGANEEFSADWVLLTDNKEVLQSPAFRAAASNPAPTSAPLWTDDYSNLFQILR